MIPKISIIIPVYNVEQYLSRCIESIQRQTLYEIEIILVNDGSTDNSLLVCKEFEKKDNRIVVLNKTNGGVSSARNAGLEVAKGEYIGFVDPDDWVESEMFGSMYEKVKLVGADICICNYFREKNCKSKPILLDVTQDLLEGRDIINQIVVNMIASPDLNSRITPIMGSVCRLIIQRKFINQHNFKFELGISLMEDLIFIIKVLLKCGKLAICNGIYYHYVINSNSAVTSYKKNLTNIHQRVYALLEQSLLEKEMLTPSIKQRLDIRYVNMCLTTIANEVHKENSKKTKEKIKFIRMVCKDSKLKGILRKINTRSYNLRKRVMLKAMKRELAFFLHIYYSLLMRITNR